MLKCFICKNIFNEIKGFVIHYVINLLYSVLSRQSALTLTLSWQYWPRVLNVTLRRTEMSGINMTLVGRRNQTTMASRFAEISESAKNDLED